MQLAALIKYKKYGKLDPMKVNTNLQCGVHRCCASKTINFMIFVATASDSQYSHRAILIDCLFA